MPAGLAIVGGSMIAGEIGASQSQSAIAAAQAARQQALQNYLDINVPDPAQQQVILQKYAVTGQLDPQMEAAVSQQATELANMSVNPSGRDAEVQALNQLSQLSQSGGMDAQARQQEEQAIQSANANEAGQMGAITQNFAARGTGGSGAQLAAELQAGQTDANTAYQGGMSAASSAEQRALQAMTQQGQLGSTLNNQDYQQAANTAAAQDTINRFNAQNSQAVENTNVSASNQAQAANLANQQAVANANVGITNQQEVQNKGLLQQQFSNELGLAGGEANAENGVASGDQQQANTTANQWSNIGSAIGQGVAAVGKSANTNGTTTNNYYGSNGNSNGQAVSDNTDDYENDPIV